MNAKTILVSKILKFQRKVLNFRVIAGLVNFLVYLLLIWLSSFMADSAIYFSEMARWFVLLLNGTITLVLFYLLVLLPLVKKITLSKGTDLTPATEMIGQMFPAIQDKIKNAYQLVTTSLSGSAAFRDLAVERFTQSLKTVDLNAKVKLKDALLPPVVILSVFLGSVFLITILNEPLLHSLKRVMNPTGNYTVIPPYTFQVEPGDVQLVAGTSAQIRARYTGPLPDKGFLYFRKKGEVEYKYKLMQESGNEWITEIENITSDLEYFVRIIPVRTADWSEYIISATYKILALIPPVINEVQIETTPPLYTGLTPQFMEANVGDFSAYPGTSVNISLRVNNPVVLAKMRFSDGEERNGEIRGEKINYSFNVKQNVRYQFELTSETGISNQNPIEYTVTVIDDQYPLVEITEPGIDVEVAADGALNLVIEANDDFGFSAMRLNYQVMGPLKETRDSTWHYIPMTVPPVGSKYFQQTYFWNFASLAVGFEDIVRYYVSVGDNDVVSGPKFGRSAMYFIRFPSVDQLFEEFSASQEEKIKDTEDLAAESEALKKELEEISREMKKEQKIDWERKRSLEAAIEKQQKMQEKLQEIEKDITEAINKLEKNNLFSPEILEKYKQLQDLFQEIATPELLAAMKDVQDALEKMNQKQAKEAVEKLKLDQERFKDNLERTLELFKKVQMEQEMDRLVKMAQDMEKEQNKLSEEIKKSSSDQAQSDDLKRQAKNQQERIDKLGQALSDMINSQMTREIPHVNDALENADEIRDQTAKEMGELTKQLGQQNRKDSAQKSSEISQQLKQIHHFLQSAQQNMQQREREKIMSAMNKISTDLLQLSQQQEQLIGETNELSSFSNRFPEVAGSQQENLENLSRVTRDIIELSQQTFFLKPGMNKSLGAAHGGMRRSLDELENRNKQTSANSQKQAMGGINESVMFMQQSMDEMANAQSALGFEQYLKQMQQLSNQQGQLNEESLNFFKGNQGSMSMEQQGQLKRMAGEQAAIRKSLEEMASGMQKRSDILGDLDHMAGEMEQVVKEMQGMQLDRKTIDRQQKILSRMLDAQKSVREKEYSKQRLAESGKTYQRKSPAPLADQEDARLKQLKRELIRALQEGYNPDYEKLIERYFRTLNENLSQ
ncbi:MAG: hypothetical protein E4H13_05920 [Calditrichales bacterium]|nr:MAG: hypothetical protein E4H13_05920 [Calditrichales bacterium]